MVGGGEGIIVVSLNSFSRNPTDSLISLRASTVARFFDLEGDP